MHDGTLNLSDDCIFTEWPVAGPEIARVITEFEAGMQSRKETLPPSTLIRVEVSKEDLQKKPRHLIIAAFQEAGNPFLEDSNEIVILNTKKFMPEEVSQSIVCP